MNQNSKKRYKSFTAVAMAILMIFTLVGCNGGGDTAGGSNQGGETKDFTFASSEAGEGDSAAGVGHWVEKDVTPSEMGHILEEPVKMEDGNLVMYAIKDVMEGPITKYTSTDGGDTWSGEVVTFGSEVEGEITDISLLPSGTMAFQSYVLDENEEYVGSSVYYMQNGETVKISSLQDKMIYSLQLMDDNTLFAYGYNNNGGEEFNYVIDLTLDTISCELQSLSMYSGAMMGIALDLSDSSLPRMYYTYFGEDGQILCAVDKNGNHEDKLATLNSDSGSGAIDEEGNYYFTSNGSIYRVTKGGSAQEQIMEDSGFELGLQNFYCSNITYVDKTAFLCALNDMSGGAISEKIMKYAWSTEPQAPIDTRLTVWSLEENATVRAAVVEFNKSNPGMEITYEVGIVDENSNPEDVIRSLNTELVAKKGPDVLIMDGLDYENYIAKGFLADISGSIDLNTLLESVSTPFVNAQGQCYVMPARFSAPVLMGDAGDVDQLKTLDDIEAAVLACQPRPGDDATKDAYYEPWTYDEQYALGFVDLEQLVDFTLSTSAPALIENGQVNHENLTKVMEFINVIGTHYQMNKYPQDVAYNGMSASSGETDPVTLDDGGYEYSVTKHARYGRGSVTTPAFFSEGRRDRMDTNQKSSIVMQPGLVENAYTPSTLAAVSATSTNPDAAGVFVATLLGDNIQNACYYDGNPIQKQALTARIEKHDSFVKEHGYTGDMQAFYDNLKTPVTVTGNLAMLRECIVTHAKSMINKTESQEDAVRGVENDVKMMFDEQN